MRGNRSEYRKEDQNVTFCSHCQTAICVTIYFTLKLWRWHIGYGKNNDREESNRTSSIKVQELQ